MERVTNFLEAGPSYLTGLQQHAHGLLLPYSYELDDVYC